MKRLLLALTVLVAAAGAKAVPTAALLEDVETWTFLSAEQQSALQSAQVALQKGEWRKALELNEKLLDSAPKSIFEAKPSLPVVLIRPAGAGPGDPQRVVAGWQWKFECAQLALLSLDFEGAVKRAEYVRDAAPDLAAESYRLMALARSRQRRYADAQKLLAEADRRDRQGREEWMIWDQAKLLTTEAKIWIDQIAVGSDLGLSGGGLPVVGGAMQNTAPDAQRVEACLVMGDWAANDAQNQLASSYYGRALQIATKRKLTGLLAVTLMKRVQPPKK